MKIHTIKNGYILRKEKYKLELSQIHEQRKENVKLKASVIRGHSTYFRSKDEQENKNYLKQ